MDPHYRGRDDYFPEESGEGHSFFHRGHPPPPPRGEDEFGGRHGFGERREHEVGGFPPEYGRFEGNRDPNYDEGFYERERYGGEEGYREGGHPPERRSHFPHQGSHHRHHEDAPSDDGEYIPHRAPPQSGYRHDGQPSDENVGADPVPAKADAVEGIAVTSQLGSLSLDLPEGRVYRIFCKQDSGYNLVVDHKTLKMQASDTDDESQHWIKDSSHGFRVKDSYGQAAFTLINKKTKRMLKHTGKEGQQVLVIDYDPETKDDDVLWTESQDFGEGFKTVRAASDTLLNLTVFEGHKRVRNGSALILDTWHKGDHQVWKLFPL